MAESHDESDTKTLAQTARPTSVNTCIKIIAVVLIFLSLILLVAGVACIGTAPPSCENVEVCLVDQLGQVIYNGSTINGCSGKPMSIYHCEWKEQNSCPDFVDCNSEEHYRKRNTGIIITSIFAAIVGLSVFCICLMNCIPELYVAPKSYVSQE